MGVRRDDPVVVGIPTVEPIGLGHDVTLELGDRFGARCKRSNPLGSFSLLGRLLGYQTGSRESVSRSSSRSWMPCVVACGAAVPWAMQVGLKRRHVIWGFARRSALAAGARVRPAQKIDQLYLRNNIIRHCNKHVSNFFRYLFSSLCFYLVNECL